MTALQRIQASACDVVASLSPPPDALSAGVEALMQAPATDAQMSALRSQVALLQEDIRRRATEEERLVCINAQLKTRLEEAVQTNNTNVDAAEAEMLRLGSEVDEARARATEESSQAAELHAELQRVIAQVCARLPLAAGPLITTDPVCARMRACVRAWERERERERE